MRTNIIISPSKLLRIELHILFWIVVLAFYTFFYGRISGDYYVTFIHLLMTLPVYLGATYFTLYHIIPKYLLQKNYRGFIISSIYTVLGAAYLELMITLLIVVFPDILGNYKTRQPFESQSLDIYLRLISIFIVVFLASCIKLLKHWYVIQRTNQLLEKEKLRAELSFLKSQINPHFLFNTLNNLYALTLKKSDNSPEVVLKLSEILDYMLYECSQKKVELKKEINLIKNYIDLESMRFGDRLTIDFQIKGNVRNVNVAPLLFFPLVENSFKHGVRNNIDSAWIKLKLNVADNSLQFEISNGKPNRKSGDEIKGGIGLENLRKRLQIIYPVHHKLIIEDTADQYSAKLKLDLSLNTARK